MLLLSDFWISAFSFDILGRVSELCDAENEAVPLRNVGSDASLDCIGGKEPADTAVQGKPVTLLRFYYTDSAARRPSCCTGRKQYDSKLRRSRDLDGSRKWRRASVCQRKSEDAK